MPSNGAKTCIFNPDGVFGIHSTWNGLYRLKVGGNGFEPLELGWRRNGWADTMVRPILEDRHGDLWVGGATIKAIMAEHESQLKKKE